MLLFVFRPVFSFFKRKIKFVILFVPIKYNFPKNSILKKKVNRNFFTAALLPDNSFNFSQLKSYPSPLFLAAKIESPPRWKDLLIK